MRINEALQYVVCMCFFTEPQVTYQTETGQTLDLLTSPDDNVDFSRFSLERYASCNKAMRSCISIHMKSELLACNILNRIASRFG